MDVARDANANNAKIIKDAARALVSPAATSAPAPPASRTTSPLLVTTAVGFAPWLTTRSAPSGLLRSVAWRRDTRGDVMLPLRSPWRPSSTTARSGSGVTRPARLRSESGCLFSCCVGCRGVARACMLRFGSSAGHSLVFCAPRRALRGFFWPGCGVPAAVGCKTRSLASYCRSCRGSLKLQGLFNLRASVYKSTSFFLQSHFVELCLFAAVKRGWNARCGAWVSLTRSLSCCPIFGRPAAVKGE